MEDVINEYFKSLNPLATKISLECEEVMHKYGSQWTQLSYQEQEALLDNYFFQGKAIEPIDLQKLLKVESGVKVVVDFQQDDMGWTWTDEHSGPFSWKTKSQQDLTFSNLDQISEEEARRRSLSRKEKTNKQHVDLTMKRVDPTTKPVDPTKKLVHNVVERTPSEEEVFICGDNEKALRINGIDSNIGVQEIIKKYEDPIADDLQKKIVNSPIRGNKNLPNKVMSLRGLKNLRQAEADDLICEATSPPANLIVTKQPKAKTGFDFLDNW